MQRWEICVLLYSSTDATSFWSAHVPELWVTDTPKYIRNLYDAHKFKTLYNVNRKRIAYIVHIISDVILLYDHCIQLKVQWMETWSWWSWRWWQKSGVEEMAGWGLNLTVCKYETLFSYMYKSNGRVTGEDWASYFFDKKL